jgi:hypothetical protein
MHALQAPDGIIFSPATSVNSLETDFVSRAEAASCSRHPIASLHAYGNKSKRGLLEQDRLGFEPLQVDQPGRPMNAFPAPRGIG